MRVIGSAIRRECGSCRFSGTTSVSPPFLRMTGDGLTALNQVSGPAGGQLVPDLATSLPDPTDGGHTYTFQLRPGIRYSTGKPVQATDFRSTLERYYALGSPVTDYDEIVGGAQCRKHPKRCDLSRGIVANDVARTVTFHLIRPDPDFLYKLASQFAYVLPGSTPRRPAGTHPLPATGPYMIATYRPRRLLRFIRNPFFHEWSRAAQPDGYPDRIDIRIAGTADDAIRDVVDGKADVVWLAEPLTPTQVSRLEVRYASQMHSAPQSEPPGALPQHSRPAVQPARRPQGDQLRRRPRRGDERLGRAERRPDDVPDPAAELPRLPPLLPVHGRLDEARHVDGTRPGEGESARGTLRDARHEGHPLGVVAGKGLQPGGREGAALARLPRGREAGRRRRYWDAVGDSRNRAQIGFDGWAGGYPDPASFLVELFSCPGSLPGSPNHPDASQFCDPGIDRQMRRAQAEQLSDPTGSRALWQRVDREITDAAPWVPLMASKNVNFLSKRVGNYQYSPAAIGMLIDQLWVR